MTSVLNYQGLRRSARIAAKQPITYFSEPVAPQNSLGLRRSERLAAKQPITYFSESVAPQSSQGLRRSQRLAAKNATPHCWYCNFKPRASDDATAKLKARIAKMTAKIADYQLDFAHFKDVGCDYACWEVMNSITSMKARIDKMTDELTKLQTTH